MKKLFYISTCVFAALVSASCKKENLATASSDNMVNVTILSEGSSTTSKTTAQRVQEGESYVYEITWAGTPSAPEKMSVFNDKDFSNAEFKGETTGEKSNFNGFLPKESVPTMALYPYSKYSKKLSETTVSTFIPQFQDGKFSNVVLAGKPTQNLGEDGYRFQFEAVSGIFRLDIPDESDGIKSVELISDLPIAGDATIDFSDKTPVMTPGDYLLNTVTVSNADGSDVKGTIYIATLPVDGPFKITLRFIKESNERAYFSANLKQGSALTANVVKYVGVVRNIHYRKTGDNVFTVDNKGNKISFAHGNLQYRASDAAWRFAENQWDAIGSFPGNSTLPNYDANIHSSREGERAIQAEWIDLFACGQTGWTDTKGNTYYPYNSLSNYFSTYYKDKIDKEATGANANADFGVYNSDKIINGDNKSWRLPTLDEIKFIISSRKNEHPIDYSANPNNKKLYPMCYLRAGINIGGQERFGIFLFPDNFDWDATGLERPTYVVPQSGLTWLCFDNPGVAYPDPSRKVEEYDMCHIFDLSEAAILEEHGVVFLPCAGQRMYENENKIIAEGFNLSGYYLTRHNEYSFAFYTKNVSSYRYPSGAETGVHHNLSKTNGYSVRLVRDVESTPVE